MLMKPKAAEHSGPVIMRPRETYQLTPAMSLCTFESRHGIRAIADVPRLSEQLTVSRGARKVIVWRTMLNEIPEEAERGEFLAIDASLPLANGKAQACCLTNGAGR